MNILEKLKQQVVRAYLFFKPFAFKKFLILALGLCAGAIGFITLLFLLVWSGLSGSLPDKDELTSVENPVASEVYSADSVLLGRYFIQERSSIEFTDLPTHVVDAVVATEDVRFYEHRGIDTRSLGRVLVKSLLLQRESSGGGSTITQQLAKNLYPRKNYWLFSLLINKIREMIVARRLENVYDKQAILALYLNTVPFGENTFGIEAAAQRFFSVHAKELTIDQGAVLIGMLKATHSYNPRLFPEQSLQRRNVVLRQMHKYNLLSNTNLDSLRALPITLNYNKITHHEGPASYFREYLRPELLAWCKAYNESHDEKINLYTHGLKIYTTLDSRLQRYAEEAVARQMKEIQKRFNNHWNNQEPWQEHKGFIDDAIQKSDRYKSLKKQGLTTEEILRIMNKPVTMTVFTWDGEQEKTWSPIDSIKHYLKFLNAGFLAMDPHTGAVRAWVGGINHHYFQFDHVRESTKRQVGSTFKPIVYAAALEQGIKPCSFISAAKTTYTNMEDWAPENTEDNYGLKYSMPGALVHSVNTVSVQVLEQTGINNAIHLARSLGIKSELQPVPSIALGTPAISMTEMVQAYAAFANSGKAVTSHYLSSITTHKKGVLQQFETPETHQALSADHAQMMLHMLKRVVDEGTAVSLRSQFGLTTDIGGKTGTTQSNTDGWFIGVTPNLVIGSWVGADDPRIRFRSTALGQGSRTALPLVGDFLQAASRDPEIAGMIQASFPPLSNSLARKIDCDLFKEDTNLIKRIFGDRDKGKEKKKEFGKKEKKGFWKRLFN